MRDADGTTVQQLSVGLECGGSSAVVEDSLPEANYQQGETYRQFRFR